MTDLSREDTNAADAASLADADGKSEISMQPVLSTPVFPVYHPVQAPHTSQAPPVGMPYAMNAQPPYPSPYPNAQPQYPATPPQHYPAGGPGYYAAPYPQHPQSTYPTQMPNGYQGNPAAAFQGNPMGGFQNIPPAGAYANHPLGAYSSGQPLMPGAPMGGPNSPRGGTGLNAEQYEDLKTAPFYNEHYKKPGKGRMKGLLAPMIIVGLLCSILGGAVTGAGFLFFSPASGQVSGSQTTNAGDGMVRKIEIVDKTSSPVTAIAEKAGPSVVGINVEFTYSDSFFGTQDGGGQGSGIIISSDGYILTNNHVVEAASSTGTANNRSTSKGKITVILPNQKDKPYVATIVGLDAKSDIAIIKIEAANLMPAEIGDSDALKVGEMAVAIGNPAGLEYMGSVTAGIISGLNREVDTGDGIMIRLIQTDAAISPGNSGGALLNSKGQVVGVNSSKIGGTSFEGLGFAIPIKDAMLIANTLMKDGFVTRPQIGVSVDNNYTADVANANKTPEGVLVGDVMPLSSAEKGGVKAGDIIIKFNGIRVNSFGELEVQKNLHKPGDKVTLEVYRIPSGGMADKGEYLTLNLDLGSTADKQQ